MCKFDNAGFNLLEVLIAIGILSIVLMGLAGLINITLSINRNSADKTVSVSLAQDKMEEMITKGYASLPSADQIREEPYGTIVNYPAYRRVTGVRMNKPDQDIKLITVDVFWKNDIRQVRLQSLLTHAGTDF